MEKIGLRFKTFAMNPRVMELDSKNEDTEISNNEIS